MNLFEAVFRNLSSSNPALVFEGLPISYPELRHETLRFAGMLKTLGVNTGDRVAVMLNDSPEFVAAFISICSSGAIAVPINMALRLEEQRAILKDSTARFALVEANLCSSLLTDASEELHLEEVIGVVRDGQETPTNLAVSNDQKPRVRPLHSLLESASVETGFPQTDPAAAAFILYTSGSTGEPKGAVHTQADIFYTNQTFCAEVLQLQAEDRLFSSSRLPFAYGLGNSLTFPLLNGVTSVLCCDKPTAEIISRIFSKDRPTIFFGVPVVYSLLLDHHRRVRQLDCSSLRLCVSAGEALPAQLGEDWEQTFGIPVLDGIGSTEMLHMFMSNHAGAVRYGSSGTLLKGYKARLLDEDGNETPAGMDGNLWISGQSAAMGYWQRPAESERTFVEGWVRTGDLYRRDADGYWFHRGRSDDCFKSSGQWVSPVEVEGVLLRHKGVSRAAVVEDLDDAGLPCPCAFIVSKDQGPESTALEEELRTFVKTSLPRFKRPRRYVFTSELPYTATGKVQRFMLRRQLRSAR